MDVITDLRAPQEGHVTLSLAGREDRRFECFVLAGIVPGESMIVSRLTGARMGSDEAVEVAAQLVAAFARAMRRQAGEERTVAFVGTVAQRALALCGIEVRTYQAGFGEGPR